MSPETAGELPHPLAGTELGAVGREEEEPEAGAGREAPGVVEPGVVEAGVLQEDQDPAAGVSAGLPELLAVLDFVHREGVGRLSFSAAGDGSPRLQLVDQARNIRGSFYVAPDGRPFLQLMDPRGVRVASLGDLANGGPSLGVFDQSDTMPLALELVGDSKRPRFGLWDQRGRYRAALYLQDEGQPGLTSPV